MIMNFSALVIIFCLLLLTIAIMFIMIRNKQINVAIKFDSTAKIENIIDVLNHFQLYNNWWARLNKLYLYHISGKSITDSNKQCAKIDFKIISEYGNEQWVIILQKNAVYTNIKAIQTFEARKSLTKILKSFFLYRSDVKSFRKYLQIKLNI